MTTEIATKRCTKCGRELPATTEWFRTAVDRPSGLRSRCRDCERTIDKARNQSPERKAYAKAYQQSPEYQAWLIAYRQSPEYKAYHKARKQSPEYKAYDKAYRQLPEHKVRQRKYVKAYRQSPKGKATREKYIEERNQEIKAYHKMHRQSPEHKVYMRAYRQSPKFRAYMKEYRQLPERKAYMRTYQKTASHRRRARQRDLPATFTATDWQRALDYFDCRCAVCKRPIGLWHTLAQDHWIPVSKGGAYTPDNIVPLCHGDGGCNNSKWNKDAHEWLMERYSARKVAQIEKRIAAYFAWVKLLARANAHDGMVVIAMSANHIAIADWSEGNQP